MSAAHSRKPAQLSLAINDLDFVYLPIRTSTDAARHCEVVCTVDCSWFYSQGANHMVFALDCTGGQGSYNPHCGPVLRHRQNLWAEARGFIIFADGAVMAERWNGTAMPGLVAVANTSGATLDPAQTPVFTVRIQAGYRAGPLADTLRIAIHQGISLQGPVLFQGEVTGSGWGWDWTGSHRVALAGIGPHFVTPNDTGCVEERVPRGAPDAVLPFTHFKLRIAKG